MSGTSLNTKAHEVDRDLAEAESLKFSDPRRMLSLATGAAGRAQNLGDFRRYARALTHQAWAYASLHRYESSLTHALEALVLSRGHGFLDIEGHAVNIIALNFIECGIVDESVRLYEHQLALAEQLNDDMLRAMGLHDLALVHLVSGDVHKAIELICQSLSITGPGWHNGLDLCITHGNLAQAYSKVGRLDDALMHAQNALELAHRAESLPLVGQSHCILGWVLIARGELQDVYRQIALAHDCIATTEPSGLAVNVEMLTAELLAKEDRPQDALLAWERAYDLSIRGQMLEAAVSTLNSIKDTHQKLGDMAGVVKAYQRLTQDIPHLQRQGSELRFTVLRMVFATDKATVQAEMQLNSQKQAILRRLSHEFRTPLTIIQTTAEMVEKYGDRLSLEQRKERLQRISGQVNWMTVMLEDIVDLLRLDDGEQNAPAILPFRLDDLARGALKGLDRYRIEGGSVVVRTEDGSRIVKGPQQVLETVLVHLLTNAIKFSKSAVSLDLLMDERGALVMRVTDQGIGILPEEQALVFQPLMRGSNLSEISGNGLGLALVARLVEQIGGTIELHSVAQVGTTVTVRVPL